MKKWFAGLTGAIVSVCAFSATVFAEGEAAATETAAPTTAALLLQLLPFGIALILLYLILLRPQQKREKEAQQMRENVRVGDEVCTAGGIVGIVVRVEKETVVLETGAERNKLRIKKWAIHENITQVEEQQKAERERKANRQKGIASAGVASDEKPKKNAKKD
ncbi:MAG: preprotein translocase subunit YajC [Oscillospiraceae bacterium]|nr:preprotein translocase subunit YajC [Oscillospiraceae bacterium]